MVQRCRRQIKRRNGYGERYIGWWGGEGAKNGRKSYEDARRDKTDGEERPRMKDVRKRRMVTT